MSDAGEFTCTTSGATFHVLDRRATFADPAALTFVLELRRHVRRGILQLSGAA